ncbi:putative fungal-specific transcription factor, partial [Plectosphaerella plurivora]
MEPSTITSRTGACQRCHYRKVRCDRKRPSCTLCARLSVTCQYTPREHQVNLRRQDVERLEQRVRRLQAENDLLQARETPSNTTPRPPSTTSQHSAMRGHLPTSTASIVEYGLRQNGAHVSPGTPGGHDEVASQVISLSLSAGGGRNFVGSTSGLFLANLLQPHGQAPELSLLPSGHIPSSGSNHAGHRVSLSTLPPKTLAIEIIDAYSNHDRLQYPFLGPKTLESALENVYSSSTAEATDSSNCSAVDAFLVNMTLAIGTSQMHKLNWTGVWDAEISYNQAVARLGDVLSQGGIPALQALLLVCQYRMSTPSSDTSTSVWHLIGVAARMCLEFGLHRASTYEAPAGANVVQMQELETKRRCFWSVVSMDRVASIALGRPLAIQLDDIDVQLPHVDPEALQNVPSAALTSHSLATATLGTTEWYLATAIFVHIVRYRLICGKILNALHRSAGNDRASTLSYEAIRNDLAAELQSWHDGVSALPLLAPDTASPAGRSSFRCQDWYNLLYHNGILMLFRPSPCLCDTSRNSTALQHVHDSSQSALLLYANLHRTGRINYSWVTLHSVFIAGLSYIYALRSHLQHTQTRQRNDTNGPSACLNTSPTIAQVVSTTRACSKVLVAVSERWAVARNCSEVFDKLSDAVVADVIESQMTQAATTQSQRGNYDDFTTTVPQDNMHGSVDEQAGFIHMSVDNTLRDCFDDLQNICYDQYHSDAIVQLSQDWLVGLG